MCINQLQKHKENRHDGDEAGGAISKRGEKDIETHIDTQTRSRSHRGARARISSFVVRSYENEGNILAANSTSVLVHRRDSSAADKCVCFSAGWESPVPAGSGRNRLLQARLVEILAAVFSLCQESLWFEDQMNDGGPASRDHSHLLKARHKGAQRSLRKTLSPPIRSSAEPPRRRLSGRRSTAPGRRRCRPPAAAPGQRNHTVGVR